MKVGTQSIRNAAIRSVFTFCIAPVLTGCAGVHLYNAENEEAGKAAKTAYEESKLLEVIATGDKNLEFLLNQELTMVERHIRAVRDAEFYRIVAGTKPLQERWIDERVNERAQELLGQPFDDNFAKTIAAEAEKREKARQRLVPRREEIHNSFTVRLPDCSAPTSLPALNEFIDALGVEARAKGNSGVLIETLLPSLAESFYSNCRILQNLQPALNFNIDTLYRQAYDAWQAEIGKLEEVRGAVWPKVDKLKTAVTELKSAQVDDGKKPSELFGEKLDKVSSALKALKSLSAFGEVEAFTEQINLLEHVLDAVSTGKTDAADFTGTQEAALKMASALPDLADDLHEITKTLDAPPVAHLAMAQALLRAQLDAAKAKVARMERRVALYGDRFAAVELEIDLFGKMLREVNRAKTAQNPSPLDMTITSALAKGMESEVQRHLYAALAYYGATITLGRGRQEKAEWRLIALDHEEAAVDSNFALAEWNAIIAGPINQQAAFHASGIKPEDIAGILVEAVGLGAIAVGTN